MKRESSHVRPITDEEYAALAREKARIIELSFNDYSIAGACNMDRENGTKSEFEEIRACASWAIDTTLRATMLSPVHGCAESSDRVKCAINVHTSSLHDFTHSLAGILDSGQPVPSFINEHNQIDDRMLIEEEVHAFHFWREYAYPPLFLCLSSDRLTKEWVELYRVKTQYVINPDLKTRVSSLIGRMLSVDRKNFDDCYAVFLEMVMLSFEIETLPKAKKGRPESEHDHIALKHHMSHRAIQRQVLSASNNQYRTMARRMFDKFTNNNPRGMFDEWLAAARKGNRLHK